jgi:hypothetical protein
LVDDGMNPCGLRSGCGIYRGQASGLRPSCFP